MTSVLNLDKCTNYFLLKDCNKPIKPSFIILYSSSALNFPILLADSFQKYIKHNLPIQQESVKPKNRLNDLIFVFTVICKENLYCKKKQIHLTSFKILPLAKMSFLAVKMLQVVKEIIFFLLCLTSHVQKASIYEHKT